MNLGSMSNLLKSYVPDGAMQSIKETLDSAQIDKLTEKLAKQVENADDQKFAEAEFTPSAIAKKIGTKQLRAPTPTAKTKAADLISCLQPVEEIQKQIKDAQEKNPTLKALDLQGLITRVATSGGDKEKILKELAKYSPKEKMEIFDLLEKTTLDPIKSLIIEMKTEFTAGLALEAKKETAAAAQAEVEEKPIQQFNIEDSALQMLSRLLAQGFSNEQIYKAISKEFKKCGETNRNLREIDPELITNNKELQTLQAVLGLSKVMVKNMMRANAQLEEMGEHSFKLAA